MSNKIAGARKKFQRVYELEFLDGPLLVVTESDPNPSTINSSESPQQQQQQQQQQLAWWEKDSITGKHLRVNEAFAYVMEATRGKEFDAIIGFSQGGLLGASLVLTGAFPTVKAVVTAGSPFVPDVFECAQSFAANQEIIESGLMIPKLHLAGQNDVMVPIESTRRLCDAAGNGRMTIHEKGHLFPTKATHVNEMMHFLESALQMGSEMK
jgi:poly(3-hydroxyalkanoate) synthetase